MSSFFTSNALIHGTTDYQEQLNALIVQRNLSHDCVRDMEAYFCIHDTKKLALSAPIEVGHPTELIAANNLIEASAAKQNKVPSKTHGARHMRFMRAARNPQRSKIGPASLDMFNGDTVNRLQLFNSWAKCKEDWGEVEVREERYRELAKEKKVVMAWRNDIQLMAMYAQDRDLVDKIKDACRKVQSLHRDCPEHPGINKLEEFYVRIEESVEHIEKDGQRVGMSMRGAVGKESAIKLAAGAFNQDLKQADPPPTEQKRGGGKVKGGKHTDTEKDKDKRKEVAVVEPSDMQDPLEEAQDFCTQLTGELGKGKDQSLSVCVVVQVHACMCACALVCVSACACAHV